MRSAADNNGQKNQTTGVASERLGPNDAMAAAASFASAHLRRSGAT